MKAYKTYQEAQIANPLNEIYVRQLGAYTSQFSTSIFFDSERCNPKEYCITMEVFLAGGYEISSGDVLIDIEGCVVKVINPKKFEVTNENQDKIYVLKAKALEGNANNSEIPNDSEWKNGDECEIEMDGRNGSYVFGCLVHGNNSAAVVFTSNGHMIIPVSRLLKPEIKPTPRELFIEAACKSVRTTAEEDIKIIGNMFDSGKFKLVEGG